MIEESRIQPLNKNNLVKGEYILYWMQASQRAEYNHALEFAINQANERNSPSLSISVSLINFPKLMKGTIISCLKGLKMFRKPSIEKA